MVFVARRGVVDVDCIRICSISPVSGLRTNESEVEVPISTARGLIYELRKSETDGVGEVSVFVFEFVLVLVLLVLLNAFETVPPPEAGVLVERLQEVVPQP